MNLKQGPRENSDVTNEVPPHSLCRQQTVNTVFGREWNR